jgi:hypothetical protein
MYGRCVSIRSNLLLLKRSVVDIKLYGRLRMLSKIIIYIFKITSEYETKYLDKSKLFGNFGQNFKFSHKIIINF